MTRGPGDRRPDSMPASEGTICVGFTRNPTGAMQFGFDNADSHYDDNGSSNPSAMSGESSHPSAMSGESSHSSRRLSVYVVYEVGSETYVRRSARRSRSTACRSAARAPVGTSARTTSPARQGVGEGVGILGNRASATTFRFARREDSHDCIGVVEQLADFFLSRILVEDVGALDPDVGQVLDLPPRRPPNGTRRWRLTPSCADALAVERDPRLAPSGEDNARRGSPSQQRSTAPNVRPAVRPERPPGSKRPGRRAPSEVVSATNVAASSNGAATGTASMFPRAPHMGRWAYDVDSMVFLLTLEPRRVGKGLHQWRHLLHQLAGRGDLGATNWRYGLHCRT